MLFGGFWLLLSDISSHANPDLWIWSASVMGDLVPILLCPGEEINLFVVLGERLFENSAKR